MKRLIYGLLVALLAVGVSAFTSVSTSLNGKENQQTRYWINDGTDYVETATQPQPVGNCQVPSNAECTIQSEDPNIPDEFPIEDAGDYDVTSLPGSQPAVYSGP